MKQSFLTILMCYVLSFSATASADKTDKLIQLLINKNIVTADEAKSILEELSAGDEEKPDKKPAKPEEKTSSNKNQNPAVKYDKGLVFKTTDNNYSMKLGARIHGMFTYADPDNNPSSSTFKIRRARILADGNVYTPWLKYSAQITLECSTAAIRDAWMEASYYKYFSPRFGQYKVPFDREFLDGGFNLQLIERSVASAEFSLQRDIGLQVSGKGILKSIDYSIGVFNGSGANQSNVDNDYMYVGRVVWAPFGAYPYSESAVDCPSNPVFAIGIAAAYMPGLEAGERKALAGKLGTLSILPVESDVTQWTADLVYKYHNLSLMSGYYYRNIDPMDETTYGEQSAWGVFLQGGYFIVPGHLEIAGRYSYIDPDTPDKVSDDEKTEYTVGLNYYLSGHNVKTGINYSYFSTENQLGDIEEHVVNASVIFQF